jgi:mono/diheme cytochrome c family protein
MQKTIQAMMLGLGCIVLALTAQESNVTLPQDKGPDKIDVSAYPADIQKDYKLFSTKCSKCHTIARPLNTLMTRDEWERYVKRMMHKPNSGISDSQGKDIFDFLMHDQTNRKDKNPKAFFRALTDEEIEKLKTQK